MFYSSQIKTKERESKMERGIDRVAINRALAKAIAYKQVGKEKEVEQWARELVRLLECNAILKGER